MSPGASFRSGWLEARRRIGWVWPASAAAAALLTSALATLLYTQAISGPGGARRAVLDLVPGVAFGLVLPLMTFATGSRLDGALDQLMRSNAARHGADRRVLALGRLCFTTGVGFAATLASATVALVLSRAVPSADLARVLSHYVRPLELAGIAALGAAAYASCLGLARLAGGRWLALAFLAADWIFGSGVGLAAWPWPRAHLRVLLGGELLAGSSGPRSLEMLLLICLFATFWFARRVPH